MFFINHVKLKKALTQSKLQLYFVLGRRQAPQFDQALPWHIRPSCKLFIQQKKTSHLKLKCLVYNLSLGGAKSFEMLPTYINFFAKRFHKYRYITSFVGASAPLWYHGTIFSLLRRIISYILCFEKKKKNNSFTIS